ncbi:AI-2E family transporter [Verrucomicrobium spinosum]|uniref:AI-2E family transporter n=1 Tax=Verrucomicrobium spinosum TaxID=2736 RepID=UPI0002E912E7|nr:AI-2E family transporter [Verrucomicrobium spinosum]
MTKIPNAFQRATLWAAITALSIAVIGSLSIGLIWLFTRVISFLQPLLIPFAVAGVLAYLLEPLVSRLIKWGLNRQRAVMLVFVLATASIVGVSLVIVPAFARQSVDFAKEVPGYAEKVRTQVLGWATSLNTRLMNDYGVDILHWSVPQTHPTSNDAGAGLPTPATAVQEGTDATAGTAARDAAAAEASYFTLQDLLSGDWLKSTLPKVGQNAWNFIRAGVGGFLGGFGFLLSLVIVPLYLYYFLTESPKIAESWSHYVPLRASQFKDEVVSTLAEINGYLIAFFRGQLVVSLINGVATGLGLVIVGVKFGWLIGLSLCVLGIIPYLGIVVCWIPAVIIASVQGGSYLIPASSPWWVFPLVVTAIFAVVQQIDGLFITPKIVGESVGLHPMTVIVSVFAWSLVMGGLLGAILAVPMTAAVKVLFQRYVWQRAMIAGRVEPEGL